MFNILLFLPKLFRYFGMFQTAVTVIRPVWPYLSRIWSRRGARPAVA